MADNVRPASSLWPRLALVVLLAALAGAGVYIVSLQGRLGRPAAAPKAQPAAPPVASQPDAPAPAAAPAANAVLTAAQRQSMLDALKTETSPERKAWFLVQQNNANTAAVLAAIQAVFQEAGWPTETVRAPYPVKSGIFVLAGEESPPQFVDSASAAFTAAGIDAQYLTGYRSFAADRKQNNPNWVGPELAEGQAFVIVIGSKPTPKAQ